MSAFEELGVSPEIIRALDEEGWLLPTPIQSECIPSILGGRDVCAAAETGSGKTGAFGIPCLQIVHETLRNKAITAVSLGNANENSNNMQLAISLNDRDKDPLVIVSPDRLSASAVQQNQWNGIRTSQGIVHGKYQWEVIIGDGGLTRVGVSTPGSQLDLGKDSKGWGYGATAKKAWNNKFDEYGEKYGNGDIVGVLLDRDERTLSFVRNGRMLGQAYQFSLALDGVPLHPHICGKGFQITLNPANLAFPISGYKSLRTLSAEDSGETLAQPMLLGQTKKERSPLCLVLEPTRDLAIQVYECFTTFTKYLEYPSLKISLLVGGGRGMDEQKQKRELGFGVDIIVGTIPKISSLEKNGDIDLKSLRFIVLDEADELLKQDIHNFVNRVKKIATSQIQSKVQTLFFSATLHTPEVQLSIDRLTVDAVWADLKGKPTVPETVDAIMIKVSPNCAKSDMPRLQPKTDQVHQKDRLSEMEPERMSQMIKILKPQIAVYLADKLKMPSCLIFCRTNVDCNNMEDYLISLGGGKAFSGPSEKGVENPYSCVVLAGLRDQNERIKNLQYFKDGHVRFIICTDVAARGIDIKNLPYLIMLSLPDDTNQWFHRVGRVGRADTMGLAISLVSTVKEKVWYHKCSNKKGSGCTNTRLLENGGCCIWYDEPKILTELNSRLDTPLIEFDLEHISIDSLHSTLQQRGNNNSSQNSSGRKMLKNMDLIHSSDGFHDPQTAQLPSSPTNKAGVDIYGKERSTMVTENADATQIFPAAKDLALMEGHLQLLFLLSGR